ncbi:MAG: 6,7-dimethyl-8-ribityllumazine synthase [Acidimicrobiales bacterium]
MAGNEESPDAPAPVLDGAGLRLGLVCSRFNSRITLRLLEGARRGLEACGVAPDDVEEAWVPGAFEIPLAAKTLARSGRVDAVVCLGCVIRGETSHYELVAGECARGIRQVAVDTGVPVMFGVLTTEDVAQAEARSEPAGGHNVGDDVVRAAVEMVRLIERLTKG